MSSSRYNTKKAKAKEDSNNDSVDEAKKPSPRRTRSSTRIRNIEGAGGSNPSFLNPTASSSARSRRQRHQHQLTSAASSTSSTAPSSRTAAASRKKPPTNNNNNSKGDLKIMSSKNNSNAAASRNSNQANNPPNDNNEEDDVNPALQRLLDRLQREHSTNFGNNRPSGGGGVNRTRARYLLEASAGNVGLASALYWEDFIAEADGEEGGEGRGEGGGVMGGNDNNNNNNESGILGQGIAAAASSASAASSSGGDNAEKTASGSAVARHGFGPPAKHHHADRKGSSPKKRKAGGGSTADNDDNNEPSKKKSKKRGLRGTTDSMLARLKSSEDSPEDDNPSDEEDGRKPSAAAGSGFDRALARARGEGLYLSETLRRAQERIDAVSGAAAAAADAYAASAAGARNDSELSAAAAEVVSRYPSLWYAASGPGGVNASGLAGALGAGSSPGRQLAGLFPNIYAAYGDPGAAQGSPAGNGRQNAFVDAMNAALRSAGAAASSNNPSAFLPGRGAAAAASSSGAAQGVGGGQSQLDYISRLLACNNNALAAAGSGADRRLDESEARALMAALAGDLAATSGAASAAGAGGNGNGSDDSDNDSSNAGDENNGPRRHGNNDGDEDNSRDDDEDAADNAAAPLRRSIRVRNRSRAGRNHPARNPPVAAARRRNNDNNNGDEEDIDDEEHLVGAVRRRALAAGNRGGVARRAPDNNASADISDTEDDDVTFLPGPVPVFRLKKGRDDGDRGRKSDQENKPKYSFEDSDNDGDHSDDESVDIDLLLHSSDAFAEPSIELWGSYPKHSPESDEDDDSDTNDNADRVIIPVSWLRTGMKLSECGNGLAMNCPSDEDWERNRRSRSALLRDGPLMGVKGLFPHNCKGVSAILSIVTALLYSGASIQGGTTVACDLKRVPFDELTAEQRKREFDPRLVDALSSLIFIAAQTGKKVCGKRLAAWESKWKRHKKSHPISPAEEDEYNTKRLSLQRRVGVCQVCWWEEDTTNGNTTVLYPENRDPYNVKFKTSFTSIAGLQSYVQTHLRSFKAPGGCALLLETILHCHGPYMPNKMSLLKCHCTESLDHLEKCAKTKNGLTLMPSDHDCVSTELLSLLLTGEFHSTLEDWSADMFGIGVLQFSSQETASLNNRLIRPIKPIWICKGDLGYSVLFVDYKGFIGSTNSLEEPGKVFKMAHWNCWSGERTGFRVITSMHDELDRRSQIQPALIISDSDDECTRTVSDSISSRLLLEQKRDEAMPWKQSGGNDVSAATNSKAHVNQDLKPITDAELQTVSFHPEDEQYYPGYFIRWRFNFGCDSIWIPFYRLRGRQRLIVEMKLAPRICGIVRSRWPLATVRDFTAGKFPLV